MLQRKSFVLLLSGLGIGAACLWFILSQIQLAEVKHDLFEHAQFSLVFPFLAAYALFFWLKAMRWRILLVPITLTATRDLLPATLIGYACNLLFPAQLGEVVRSYVLGNRLQAYSSPILATIVVERMFDILTLLLLTAWMVVSATQRESPSLQTASYIAAASVTVLFLLLIVGLYHTDRFLAFCRFFARTLPVRLSGYVLLQLERGAKGLQAVRAPRLLARIALVSMIMWVLMAAAVYVTLVALQIDVAPSAAVIVLLFTVIGFALPAMPGYVGTVQVSFLLALLPYGISPDRAVAASIFYHVLITVPPLLVAAYFMARVKRTPVFAVTAIEASAQSQSAGDRFRRQRFVKSAVQKIDSREG